MSYTFTKILSSSVIGDSLLSINQNYSNLNNWVNDAQYAYNEQIIPVIGFFLDNLNYIQESLTFIQNNSATLKNFNTLISTNSSKWLNPITSFYPEILPNNLSQKKYIDTVESWINKNFTVKNSELITPNYIQNQQAIIYLHTYNIRNNNITSKQTSTTTCKTANSLIVANCVTYSTGTVHCNQYTFDCNDPKTKKPFQILCSQAQNSNCTYGRPYINIVKQNSVVYATGYITANISINYEDRSEDLNIKTMSFKVVDCAWVFDKFLIA